ncbi:hypothetical protein, partial [Sphaerisporangium album]|uniref:hypothetical protein n=1 Tax=Sphaerisporangium album TaxID=509200 RepID=UPI001C6935D2
CEPLVMVDLGRQPFYQRLLYFSIKTTDLSPPCDLQHHGEMGSVRRPQIRVGLSQIGQAVRVDRERL